MKVIMIKDLPGLGEEGDVKEVARGYARNYLFPQGFAVDDTPFNRNRMKEQNKKIEQRKVEKREGAREAADELSGMTIHITAAAGDNQRLFGAVHEADIKKALQEKGYEVEKKSIQLSEPIKNLGIYQVPVRVYENITAQLKVTVTREGEPVETGAAAPEEQEAAPQEAAPQEAAPQAAAAPEETAAAPEEASAAPAPAAQPVEEELPAPAISGEPENVEAEGEAADQASGQAGERENPEEEEEEEEEQA